MTYNSRHVPSLLGIVVTIPKDNQGVHCTSLVLCSPGTTHDQIRMPVMAWNQFNLSLRTNGFGEKSTLTWLVFGEDGSSVLSSEYPTRWTRSFPAELYQ